MTKPPVFQPVLAMLRMKFLPARDSVGESVLKVPDSASGISRAFALGSPFGHLDHLRMKCMGLQDSIGWY